MRTSWPADLWAVGGGWVAGPWNGQASWLWCPGASAGSDCGRLAFSSGGSSQAPGCGAWSWGRLALGSSAEVTAPRPHEQPWGRRHGCEELPRPAGRTKRGSRGGLLVETALLETGLRDSDMQTGASEPRPPPPGQSVQLERVLTRPPTLLSSDAENLGPGLLNRILTWKPR